MSDVSIADKRQFIADTKKFFAQFPSFLKAAEILESVAGAEQATAEANSKLEAVRRELDQAEEGLKEKLAEHARITADKIEIAERHVKMREDDATNIINGASERAESIIQAANTKAAEKLKSIDGERNRASEMLAHVRGEIAELKVERDDLSAQVDQAAAALENTRDEHAKVLKEHREFLAKIGARG